MNTPGRGSLLEQVICLSRAVAREGQERLTERQMRFRKSTRAAKVRPERPVHLLTDRQRALYDAMPIGRSNAKTADEIGAMLRGDFGEHPGDALYHLKRVRRDIVMVLMARGPARFYLTPRTDKQEKNENIIVRG